MSETYGRRVAAGLLAAALTVVISGPAWAVEAREARHLVNEAAYTFENFAADPSMQSFRDLAQRAKGILIVPQSTKAAFLLGGSGGSGVLLVRGAQNGAWNGPAFYTLGGASFGFQAGAQTSELVVLAMTERGVNAMLRSNIKLGADIGVAVGPAGAGVGGASAGLSGDLLVYSRSKGLYLGFSVNGAVLGTRGEWNRAYYGTAVSPTDILVHGQARNEQASGLVAAVRQVAGGS